MLGLFKSAGRSLLRETAALVPLAVGAGLINSFKDKKQQQLTP